MWMRGCMLFWSSLVVLSHGTEHTHWVDPLTSTKGLLVSQWFHKAMLSDVCRHIRTLYKTGWYLHMCVCDGSAMLPVVGCRLQLCRCFSTVSLCSWQAHKSFTLSLPLLQMDLWRNPSRPLTTFSSPQRLSCSTLTEAWDATMRHT